MEEVKKEIIQNEEAIIQLRISDLLALKPLNTYLYELLNSYGFSTIDKIAEALNVQSGKQFFSSTHQLLIDREFIFISELDVRKNELIIVEEKSNFIKSS